MLNVKGMTPMSAKETAIYMDGIHQTNATGFEFKATITTKPSAVLGQRGETTRVENIKYTGTFKLYKRDPWLQEYIKFVQEHGYHKRFDLTGLSDSEGSDYYQRHGSQTVTMLNCVLTGDITLLMGDTNGDDVLETLSFEAETML